MKNNEIIDFALSELKKAGADKAQCFFEQSTGNELSYELENINSLRTTFENKLSLSVIKDNRKGDVEITNIDEKSIIESVRKVIEIAGSGEPDEAYNYSDIPIDEEFVRGGDTPDLDKMYESLSRFLEHVNKSYPKVSIFKAFLGFNISEKQYANSYGVTAKSKKGYYDFFTMFAAKDGDKISSFNHTGFTSWKLDKPLEKYGLIDDLIRQSQEQIHAKMYDGKFEGDIIVSPERVMVFVYFLIQNFLSNYALISGKSRYKNELNKKIFSENFNLKLMPCHAELVEGSLITEDGFKAEDQTLFENGILKSFYLDYYGSKKCGLSRTANQSMCYVMDEGNETLEQMIKSVKKGILLNRFSGGMPNDAGDFSGVAKNSYLIENGEIKYPLSETMITANLLEMFDNITAFSKRRVNSGLSLLPWVKFSGISVSGK